jgi:hypothetical protein
MRRLVCLSLVMLLASCSDKAVEEPDWRFITDSADHALFCVDQNSLQRGLLFGPRRAWVKTLQLESRGLHRSRPSPTDLQSVEYLRLEAVDCGARTTTTTSWIEQSADRSRSGTIPEKGRVAEPVVPGSAYATVVNAICRGDLSRLDKCPDRLEIPTSAASSASTNWLDYVSTP